MKGGQRQGGPQSQPGQGLRQALQERQAQVALAAALDEVAEERRAMWWVAAGG